MKIKSVLIIFYLFTMNIAEAQDYFPLQVGYNWKYNVYNDSGVLIGIDSFVCENASVSGDTTFYHFVSYIDSLSGGSDNHSTIFYNGLSDPNSVYTPDDDLGDFSLFLHEYIPFNDNPPFLTFLSFFITPHYIGDYAIEDNTFHNCFWLKFSDSDSSGYIVAPNVGVITAIEKGVISYKLMSTNFSYSTEIVPPECTVDMENQTGAVWLTPASGYLGCNYFVMTNLGDPSIDTLELNGADFSAAPLSNDQPGLSFNGNSPFKITFEEPVSHLRLYTRSWRKYNYVFNHDFTILSESGFEVHGDTLAVVENRGNGIIEFPGPLTELTIKTDQPCCSAQALSLGLTTTCSDTYHCPNSVVNNSVLPVSIYPNPAKDFIHIELDQFYSNITVEITGLTGQMVSRKNYKNARQLTQKLESRKGFYVVKISDNEGKTAVVKLLKN